MSAIPMPALGAFLHSHGLRYCLEVLAVYPADPQGLPMARCRRWGFNGTAVVDDGHLDIHCVDLRYRGPGAWTTPWPFQTDPDFHGLSLWRQIPAPKTVRQAAATPRHMGRPAQKLALFKQTA